MLSAERSFLISVETLRICYFSGHRFRRDTIRESRVKARRYPESLRQTDITRDVPESAAPSVISESSPPLKHLNGRTASHSDLMRFCFFYLPGGDEFAGFNVGSTQVLSIRDDLLTGAEEEISHSVNNLEEKTVGTV